YARRGVQRIEPASCGDKNAPLRSVLPINDATIDAQRARVDLRALERVEHPELFPGRRLECERLQLWRRRVEDAVYDDGIALDLGPAVGPRVSGVIRPLDREARHVRRCDLIERGILP